jgi:hypothetical protein
MAVFVPSKPQLPAAPTVSISSRPSPFPRPLALRAAASPARSGPYRFALAAAAWVLAACSTAPVVSGSAAASRESAAAAPENAAVAATPPASAPPARTGAAAPRPFADVVKGATRSDGFIPVWRKDEKVWLEVAPDRLGQLMLVSVNIAQSVGERGLYGSQMGPRWMVEWRLVGQQMQLLARQSGFRGDRDPALRQAVGQAFSDSLIGSSAVASAPHPETKAVLVDAAFLLGDMAGYSTRLEAAFRLPFAPDRANSHFTGARSEAGLTTLTGRVHYAVPRLPAPALVAPGAPPPPPRPSPPSTTADPRSLFVGFVYNFRELPAQPMAPRRADVRVGYFTDSYTDLSDDLRPDNRVHHVRRWRLEKKDPAAALSEPVRPITYWLDSNVPARYRDVVTEGILEWNKAFERIGFRNAIVVKQQADDADFDTLDAGHASVRWFVGADVGFAIGPSHSDPRSGEILDADIGMSDVFGRGARRAVREDMDSFTASFTSPAAPWRQAVESQWPGAQEHVCSYAEEGAQEMGFALELLAARGDLDPESPPVEAFVRAYIRDVVMHEVGHTLGLRHNFLASTTVTREQLRDEVHGRTQGISGSVMDYNPFNLPLQGQPRGVPLMATLGPYDYWAIEYAYKPVDTADPAGEAAALRAVAERSRVDPALAFADDTDAGFGNAANPGLDPRVNRFDAGDDPLAFATHRMALTKELWQRVQQRGVREGDDALRLRRSVLEGLRQAQRVPPIAAKYLGGMYVARDIQGTGQPGYRPVEPERQREALQWLAREIFSAESFRFRPEFLASLTPDFNDPRRDGPPSVPQIVARLQGDALDRLLDAGTARRLLELPLFLPEPERRGAITLAEVYGSLQAAVWSELTAAAGPGRAIDPMRRALQREYLGRVQKMLTRPNPGLPADALSLARWHAGELQRSLRTALARGGWSLTDRAHLQDAQGLLTQALQASMQRQ